MALAFQHALLLNRRYCHELVKLTILPVVSPDGKLIACYYREREEDELKLTSGRSRSTAAPPNN